MVENKFDYRRSPIIMAFGVFFSASLIAIVLKLLFGVKNISIEAVLIPMSMIFPMLYGSMYKEALPKSSRIKYSVMIAVLYLLLGIFSSCFSPKISQSPLLNIIIIGSLVMSVVLGIVIYFVSGRTSKRLSKYDYEKIAVIQKTLPRKDQIKGKVIALTIMVFFTLPLLFPFLKDKNLIHLTPTDEFLFFILWFIIIFSATKYFKRNYILNYGNSDSINNKEDVV